MASDGNPATILMSNVAQASPAAIAGASTAVGGKALPTGGKIAAQPATGSSSAAANNAATSRKTDSQSLVDLLNKYLNDSGRPDQYRVDPASGDKLIQQINPATGAVIGEFSASEFPALARSVGATGLLIDSRV